MEKADTFSQPRGIFVTDNGDLFVADSKNTRVVWLDKTGNLVRVIGAPSSEALTEDFYFQPCQSGCR